MSYKIAIRDVVHNDINNFANYLYQRTFSMKSALLLRELLYWWISSLNIFPYRCQEIWLWYRALIVKWVYKIIYKVIEEEKKVVIIRVIRSEANLMNFID